MRKILMLAFAWFTVTAQAQHRDCLLWYDKPAANWNEALPVGNGRLGAMVFGDFRREVIQLNEESLWAGCKSEADADAADRIREIKRLLIEGKIKEAAALSEKSLRSNPLRIRSYQSFGNLWLDFMDRKTPLSAAKNYRRKLNLETGIALVEYTVGDVRYKREVFASAKHNLIALRVSADRPGALTFRLQYNREQDVTSFPVDGHTLGISGQIFDHPSPEAGAGGLHMKFAGRIAGFHRGGSMTVCSNAFYVEHADEAVFYFTAATNYNFSLLDADDSINPMERCADILAQADNLPFSTVRDVHIQEHGSLFNRVVFNMGQPSSLPTDKRLEQVRNGQEDLSLIALYFQYGCYLLMDSSRSPGVLPANLQGIWNEDMNAAWNSDFHTNINIQMNYWPVEVCNLSESFLPFSNLINALRVPGRVTARKTYGSEGWTMNHLTDPFGRTSISDGVGWGTFPIAGAWLVLHQWEHYRFTLDKEYLENEAYPSMKEAAEFILGFLTEDKNGYLVTAPSNSPENSYRLPNGETYMLTYGATMDIEIIRELLTACRQAGEIVGSNGAFDKRIKETLRKLPPLRISRKYNTIQEWIEDYDEVEPGHRHISHLFGLYPGTTINRTTPELFEAARRTIERRRYYNEDAAHKNGSYTGWSRAWMINFYARLMDGDKAGENVQMLLAKNTQGNLFNLHPPFQIDGNFGGTAGIAEMLLQSHDGEVHLLPALPSSWRDGEIRGLCARRGITVDMKWADAALHSVRLVSTVSQKVKVRYNGKVRTVRLQAGEETFWKVDE